MPRNCVSKLNPGEKLSRLLLPFITTLMLAGLTACAATNSAGQSAANTGLAEQNPRQIFEMNFDAYAGEYKPYTQSMLRSDFDKPGVVLGARASGEIRGLDSPAKIWPARNAAGQGHLKADFPANIASGKESGFLFDLGLRDMEIATMEYKVKFGDDFIWAAGGKLPGLGGAVESAGIPVGCTKNKNNIENGFSARLMWRRDGRLVVYSYFPDRQKNCGEDIPFFKAKAGQWYTIRQAINLNTPGQRDGKIWMYVDGKLVFTKDDVLFRGEGKSNVKINAAIFHTYRGGKATDPRFLSPEREFIYFDDFKIWHGHQR